MPISCRILTKHDFVGMCSNSPENQLDPHPITYSALCLLINANGKDEERGSARMRYCMRYLSTKKNLKRASWPLV